MMDQLDLRGQTQGPQLIIPLELMTLLMDKLDIRISGAGSLDTPPEPSKLDKMVLQDLQELLDLKAFTSKAFKAFIEIQGSM
jgi:hypothetical protein